MKKFALSLAILALIGNSDAVQLSKRRNLGEPEDEAEREKLKMDMCANGDTHY